MNKELINHDLTIRIPDGFRTMTAEELRQVFQKDDPNRWGTWDRAKHVMITVLWKDYSSLAFRLFGISDLKALCGKNEKLTAKAYAGHDYRSEGFFSLTVGGKPAEGYRFSYSVGDVRQSAEAVLIAPDRTVYSIICAGRIENRAADHETFTGILEQISFS